MEATVQEAVALEQATPEVQQQIAQGLSLRKQAWELSNQAKELKEKADDTLMSSLTVAGYKSVKDDVLGGVCIVESDRKSLKQNKLEQALLKRGMQADVIRTVIDEATDVSQSIYIKYTPPKS